MVSSLFKHNFKEQLLKPIKKYIGIAHIVKT